MKRRIGYALTLTGLSLTLVCGLGPWATAQETDATAASNDSSTTDDSAVIVTRFASALAKIMSDDAPAQIEVRDIYTIHYAGTQRLVGSEPFTDRTGNAVLTFPIPPQASRVTVVEGIDPKQLGTVKGGVGTTVPLEPNEEVRFHLLYFLPADDPVFTQRLPYPTQAMRVAVQESVDRSLRIEGLNDEGMTTIEGAGSFHIYTGTALPAGRPYRAKSRRMTVGIFLTNLLESHTKSRPMTPKVFSAHLAVALAVLALLIWAIRQTLRRSQRAKENAGGRLEDISPLDALGAPCQPAVSPAVALAASTEPAPAKNAAAKPAPKRARRGKKPTETERLAEAIARLDIRYEKGQIAENEYFEERGRLKDELAASTRA